MSLFIIIMAAVANTRTIRICANFQLEQLSCKHLNNQSYDGKKKRQCKQPW